jgi:hypothetical protein
MMDSIHAWEMTLLEPTNFWGEVPPYIAPRYHFYNAPVSKENDSSMNPLNVIQTVATPEDFVTFKLDIDTPEIEVPLALRIASDPKIASLIDEFFFELHFQCELIKNCWGSVPDYVEGLRLNRHGAMSLFLKLRNLGVRAHFWV